MKYNKLSNWTLECLPNGIEGDKKKPLKQEEFKQSLLTMSPYKQDITSKMIEHKRRRRVRTPGFGISRYDSISTEVALVIITLCLLGLTRVDGQDSLQNSVNNPNSRFLGSSVPTTAIMSNNINQHQQPYTASFSTPNQAINITHVTYDPLHDKVYLGATNAIYQLDGSDLSEEHEQSTGPVLDNPSCSIADCHGYEDLMKLTQNVNKVLVIDYQHKKLLSCGSTKQGACRRYNLNDITQAEDLIPMAVAANDDNSSTYAFIAPARYNMDSTTTGSELPISTASLQQQQVLYVATTYTKVGQSRDLLVPAIGTRILDAGPNLLKLYENSFLDSARIDINSHLRDYFLVNYLYGFASSNYIYFVTLQKKATSRDYEELGYHTRLARICITDSSYNSYTEVDLKCMPNKRKSAPPKHPSFFAGQANQQQQTPSEYPLLQDAILVDAGSQLLQSLALSGDINPITGSGSPDDSKVLLGVFSSAKDHTQHAGEHSALCAFSLSQIEDKFSDNIHNCYTGKMQSRNMEYIAGNVQECPKSGQAGNVVNFCHETLKINGTLPIVSEASIQFYNTTLTAITATSLVNSNSNNIYSDQLANEMAQFNITSRPSQQQPSSSFVQNPNTVVFMGTSNGHIKKVLLNNASNGIEFEDVQLDINPIIGDLHLHSSGQQLIAATPYKVMKLPTNNCAQYANCRECSQSKNPYCGWCSLKRSCTTKTECVLGAAGEQPAKASAASLLAAEASKQLKWISNDSAGKCIDLQAIVPDKIPITSTGKIDLHIERLPRLPSGQSYKCIFDRKEQTTATPSAFGLSCPLPKVMHRPKIQPGRDHAIVDLAVRSSETNSDFLNGKVTFFECQLHTTCKDCLTTNWGCNWCLNENICLFNTSKCEKTGQPVRQEPSLVQLVVGNAKSAATTLSPRPSTSLVQTTGIQRPGNTINLVNMCPTFDVGHKQDILIADGSEKELAIKVKNMPQFKGNIQCIVEIENDKMLLKARIEDDRVVCESANYSYAADVGLLNGQLVVIYSDNNISIDRTNFTLYKCHLLGAYLNRPDCSLCQRIDARFNCAWCAGGCQHRQRCGSERPDESCPPPRIDYVHPLSGPVQGGTRVTIEGSNLGQSFSEIANRVSIGNVPCRPIEDEYRPSNKIVCLTGPVLPVGKFGAVGKPDDVLLGDVIVGNKLGYSTGPAKFQFRQVQLRDHQPRYGPQSGGTRVTLTGANLNIGSSIQVLLDELPCLVEPGTLSAEQVVCRTSASRQASRAIRQLRLIVDDVQILRDDEVFYYTQDPTISRISPLKSYLSGGRPINVFGANLTAVQQPRVAIIDAAGKKVNESACFLQDDTRMQCPSPQVNLQMMELEWSEQHVPAAYDPAGWRQQLQQQDEMVKFRLSFIMDNVARLRDLQGSSVAHEIAYTSDPKLFSFASEQFRSSQELASQLTGEQPQHSYQVDPDTYLLQPGEPLLVLYGEQLRAAVSDYEITVTVGQDLCNLTSLSQTKLVCLLPLDHMATPTDEEGRQTARALPLVVVRIGFNLRYELGYVQYHPQLVEQIVQTISSSSAAYLRPAYPQYTPRENESLLHKIAGYISTTLTLVLYIVLGSCLLALLHASLSLGFQRLSADGSSAASSASSLSSALGEYRRFQSKMDSLEKSLKGECRLASMALRSELSELIRHVELTGVPILSVKRHIIKVFFPGINNHPLLAKQPAELMRDGSLASQPPELLTSVQTSIARPLGKTSAEFPMDNFQRLILTKPFLVTFINTLEMQASFSIRDRVNVASLLMVILLQQPDYATDILRTLLFQLVEKSAARCQPIGQSTASRKRASRAATLGKKVGGGLVAGTAEAAQLLLSRVNMTGGQHKTSPLQAQADEYLARDDILPMGLNGHMSHCMSTTTFNQRGAMINTIGGNRHPAARQLQPDKRQSQHLMLRRTESVVEKMLSNWLALNMYEHFQGELGQALYLMFEALKSQLERGPIDSLSGDAYYSLSEAKLLREPVVHFEPVNLYVIVDTEILQPSNKDSGNLLLDNSQVSFGEQPTNNTVTLIARALDCDTISQVKGKILSALYRNTAHSNRLTVCQVELSLRQQQQQQAPMGSPPQCVNIVLNDEDYSSVIEFNGCRRINTLQHYGISDQAIMILSRSRQQSANRVCRSSTGRTTLTDMLDEHYNNPYSEIQYAPVGQQASTLGRAAQTQQLCKSWHLVRNEQTGHLMDAPASYDSSPSSNSPSMLLLGNDQQLVVQAKLTSQQYYHPSSSSTSSGGNVLDTNSTSANSCPMNAANQQLLARRNEQPIYCQIGSTTRSQHGAAGSGYYCQIGHNNNNNNNPEHEYQARPAVAADQYKSRAQHLDQEQERQLYLSRMLTSKGAVQTHIDDFFKTILNAKRPFGAQLQQEKSINTVLCADSNTTARRAHSTGACPSAVKWLFDLLDEAAMENGITDTNVIHSWKSNAFLLRFWVNLIKNPNYILDVEKSNTLDASLSVIAQTLMDSCSADQLKANNAPTCNKLLFAKDIPKYKDLVKRFYQDIASMRPVSDQEIVKQLASLPISQDDHLDTNLALKELCVYAVNYGMELMGALNNDYTCQQLDLSQRLEQCFRSFTIFEAYR